MIKPMHASIALAIACAGIAQSVSATSIIDFYPGSTNSNTEFFTEFYQGGALAGESLYFDNVFFDCNLCDVTGPPDQQEGLFRSNRDGFTNASGGNPGLYDVTSSVTARWTGGSVLNVNDFDGLIVSGPGLAPTTILDGLPDYFVGFPNPNNAEPFTLDTPIIFEAGVTYTIDVINSGAGRDDVWDPPNFGRIEFATWEFEEATTTVIPVPAALPLLGGALGLLALVRRRG